ncbi:MAG: hypothetical protein V2A79_12585 [Planctomycetota bacterium]
MNKSEKESVSPGFTCTCWMWGKMVACRVVVAAGIVALTAMTATPAQALIIEPGIDLLRTPATSSTWIDFHDEPIPADFFGANSEPFMGSITLVGEPLVTDPPLALYPSDTIVE